MPFSALWIEILYESGRAFDGSSSSSSFFLFLPSFLFLFRSSTTKHNTKRERDYDVSHWLALIIIIHYSSHLLLGHHDQATYIRQRQPTTTFKGSLFYFSLFLFLLLFLFLSRFWKWKETKLFYSFLGTQKNSQPKVVLVPSSVGKTRMNYTTETRAAGEK